MKTFSLTGTLRNDFGKKAAKKFRKESAIPCVLYGGESTTHFSVGKESVRKLIYTPDIHIVNLTVEGKTCTAILKELQFHPVSEEVLHIDFLEVFPEKPVVMNVPVVLEGLAEGVKAGGKLALEMRLLKVKAIYTDIPEKLFINVENLGLGKTIQVGELSFDKLELLNAKNAVVCAVKLTRAARGLAAAAGK